MRATLPLPTSAVDLFADDVLHDPYPALRRLREAGPAGRLTTCDAWVLPRSYHVRAALADHERFSSALGVGYEDQFNDEYFYVLEGESPLHTGDGEATAGPGCLLAATRGTPHGFRNNGAATARALCLYTPAGNENCFRDVHAAVNAGAEATDRLPAEFRSQYRTNSYPLTSDMSQRRRTSPRPWAAAPGGRARPPGMSVRR